MNIRIGTLPETHPPIEEPMDRTQKMQHRPGEPVIDGRDIDQHAAHIAATLALSPAQAATLSTEITSALVAGYGMVLQRVPAADVVLALGAERLLKVARVVAQRSHDAPRSPSLVEERDEAQVQADTLRTALQRIRQLTVPGIVSEADAPTALQRVGEIVDALGPLLGGAQ